MRTSVFSLVTCLLLLGSMMFAQENSAIRNDKGLASARDVGKEVQRALLAANDSGLSGLHLTSAKLTLETSSAVAGDVQINFLIFTLQHKDKKSETATAQFEFSPPKPKTPDKGLNALNLAEPLAQAIAAAAATAAEINVPSLPLNKTTITINFAVSKDNGGSLSFVILGAKIGGGAELEKTSKNTLEVSFSK